MAAMEDRRLSLTNNFLIDFDLRRQSLVSFNRVFGVGEAGVASHPAADVTPRDSAATAASIKLRRKSVNNSSAATNNAAAASGGYHHSHPLKNKLFRSGGFSLARMAEEQRARKVRFYRNGDRFFKGMVIAVSAQRFRNFESLLNSLTMSYLCDKRVMPRGVRHVFTSDGAKRIDSLEQLEEGESYVCASTDVFRSLDYSRNESPVWNRESLVNGSSSQRRMNHSQLQQHYLQQQRQQQQQYEAASAASGSREGRISASALAQYSTQNGEDAVQPSSSSRLKSSKSEMTPTEKAAHEEYMRSFVVPRLITVVRQGKRPRRSVRLLLNSKTAKNIDQVLEDIAESVKMDCGTVKKLYTASGRQVSCLRDFFEKDSVFLACGTEKPCPEDFILDPREVRQVYAYRHLNGPRQRPRVTLRSAPSSRTNISVLSGATTVSSRSTPLQRPTSKNEREEGSVESNPTLEEIKEDVTKIPMPLTLTTKYEIGSVIGTGNFAVVFECKEKKTKKKFALKVVNKNSCKDREKIIDNEVRILRRLNHPNIVRLVEDYTFQHRVFYVMDLVKGGDLFDAICSSRKYTEQDARSIVFNLASALDYLHSLKIVHRDVKPENILIRLFDDGTKSLKLGDFGLATEVKSQLYAVCGTPSYVAPEVIAENGYNTKVDVWSMGVITYILLCGFPPFVSSNDDQEELFDLIQTSAVDFPSPFWDNINSSAQNLILCMLEKDQTRRVTAKQVLDHTWIVEDTIINEDLHSTVTSGLTTNFRRSTHSAKRREIQLIANLERSSRYFQGRGLRKN